MKLVRVPYWQKIRATAGLQSFSFEVKAPPNAIDVVYGTLASRYYLISTGASQWVAARGLRSLVMTKNNFDQNWANLDPREIIGIPSMQTGLADSYNWVLGAGDAQALSFERVGDIWGGDVYVGCQAPSNYNGTYGWVVFGAVLYEVDTSASDPLSLL